MSDKLTGKCVGVRYCVEIYVASTTHGHRGVHCVRTNFQLPAAPDTPDLRMLLEYFGEIVPPDYCDDWRLMTDAEIADYRANED